MASRYWIGGTGNWSNNIHWSDSSGGVGGANVPTENDDVYFDANSFNATGQIVTLDSGVTVSCRNMEWTGVLYTPTLNASNSIHFFGDVKLNSNMICTNTGVFYFNGATTSLDTKGVTLTNKIHLFYGALSLLSNISTSSSVSVNSNTTLNTNNFNITASYFYTYSGGILNLGTSKFTMTGSSVTFTGNSKTFYDVEFTGTNVTISGSNTFNNLTIAPGKTITFIAGTTQTVKSLTIAGLSDNLITLKSSVSGTPFTLSCINGTNIFNYCSIKDCTVTGGATWKANSDTCINAGGNNGILFKTFNIIMKKFYYEINGIRQYTAPIEFDQNKRYLIIVQNNRIIVRPSN